MNPARWLLRTGRRLWAAGGLTVAQLRHHRLRLGLAVFGIVLAVLATTLLAGAGLGVLETGQAQFDAADRDLWVTAGETRITATGGGGFENSLHNSREVADEIAAHDGVDTVIPMSFETVYVATEPDADFRTFIATGVTGGGSSVSIDEGEDLRGDPHYANGTYEGEMTHDLLLDRETARDLNVSIGDTLNVGGSLAAARENEFTVVGYSPTYQQMLGTPTITLPLSELHQITSSTGTEPATFITVSLEEDADIDAVQTDLQESYPEYDIRTNSEQLEATLQEQVLVLAAASALVVLAIGAGIALTVALLGLVVYQQRQEFAALKAQGISSSTLVATVIGQGVLIGALGGTIAIALTPPMVALLNRLAAVVVGFDGLVQTAQPISLAGMAIAVGIGTIAAAIAGWRVGRTPALEQL